MSQAAVFNTCQIPFRSGFPATVRRGVEAAGLAPGVCGAAGVSANQRMKSTETAPGTNFVSLFICRLFDPNGWLILPTDAAAVKPHTDRRTAAPCSHSMKNGDEVLSGSPFVVVLRLGPRS